MILFSTHSYGKSKPNFILILTDDQSWVGTSVLMKKNQADSRSDYYQTPHLKKLAAQGMVFSQAYAPAPFCCPTRRSIQVGQSPARHVYQKDRENWATEYRRQLSIAQMLKKADPNYRTAHFGKWDMRHDQITPQDMGYDESDGPTGNGEGNNGSKKNKMFQAKDPKLCFSITERASAFMER